MQSIENNLYRAPIYKHKFSPTDFLIIRKRRGDTSGKGALQYFVRRVKTLYVVGQTLPLVGVPTPNSALATDIQKDRLYVGICRLFNQKHDEVRKAGGGEIVSIAANEILERELLSHSLDV